MKGAVSLAIVLVTLLGVSSLAFAVVTCIGDQELCYDVTVTDTNGMHFHYTYKFCLNSDGTGGTCVIGQGCAGYLNLFGGGPGWFNTSGDPAFGGKPNWSIWIAHTDNGYSGYYQPIGGVALLTGVETVGNSATDRYNILGIQVPCP
jgi:hypothetical protein